MIHFGLPRSRRRMPSSASAGVGAVLLALMASGVAYTATPSTAAPADPVAGSRGSAATAVADPGLDPALRQGIYSSTDPSWATVKRGLDITGENLSVTVKGTQVPVDNEAVESTPVGDRSFEPDIKVHVPTSSTVPYDDRFTVTRWYQEDGNTQVFRLFEGDENVSSSRAGAARSEAFAPDRSFKVANDRTNIWSGRFHVGSRAGEGFSIFQSKAASSSDPDIHNISDAWSVQLNIDSDGRLVVNERREPDTIVYDRDMTGRGFDAEVRDDGEHYEVYVDGTEVASGRFFRHPSLATTFRWGMYMGAGVVDDGTALLNVSGARVSTTPGRLGIADTTDESRIPQDIKLHTVLDSSHERSEFPDLARWYREAGNTQVFIQHDGDVNTQPGHRANPRTEAFTDSWESAGSSDWHEFAATYDSVTDSNVDLVLLQLKSSDASVNFAFQVYLKADGRLLVRHRDQGATLIDDDISGAAFDLRAVSNGQRQRIYYNSRLVSDVANVPDPGGRAPYSWRWGAYTQAEESTQEVEVRVSDARFGAPALEDDTDVPPSGTGGTTGTCTIDRPTADQRSPVVEGSPFREVVDGSRWLQWPTSSPCLREDDLAAQSIVRDHFYLDTADQLVFDIGDGDTSDRVELRGTSFSATATDRVLTSRYALSDPAAGTRSEGLTIGQLFSESRGVPVLRLEVIHERRADGTVYIDNLFAIWKTPDGESVYRSLGPVADQDDTGAESFGAVDLTYGAAGQTVVVSHQRDGEEPISHQFELGDYAQDSELMYFKSGCYLQDPGTCRVVFDSLSFDGAAAR